MKHAILAALVTFACLDPGATAQAQPARDMYNRAMAQERARPRRGRRSRRSRRCGASSRPTRPSSASIRPAATPTTPSGRPRTSPRSPTSVSATRPTSKTAARLFTLLAKEYPSSKLVRPARRGPRRSPVADTGVAHDPLTPAPAISSRLSRGPETAAGPATGKSRPRRQAVGRDVATLEGHQAVGAAGRDPAHRRSRRRSRLPPGRDRQPAAAVLRSQGCQDRADACRTSR